jgi:hypothetical protein
MLTRCIVSRASAASAAAAMGVLPLARRNRLQARKGFAPQPWGGC